MAQLSQVLHPPLPLPDSIWQMLNQDNSDNPAVTVLHQRSSQLLNLIGRSASTTDHLSWSFTELERAILTVATHLLDQGVKRGSILFTILPNGVENILMIWISALLQLTLVPLDVNVLRQERREQLEYYLRSVDGREGVAVVPDQHGAERIDETLRLTGRRFQAKVMVERGPIPGWTSLTEMSTSAARNDPRLAQDTAIDRNGERIAAILHTSGTSTGKPKGCPLSVRNIMATCASKCALAELTDCFMSSAPNFGVIFTMMVFLYGSKGSEFLMPAASFSPTSTLDAMERFPQKSISTIFIPAQIGLLSIEQRTRTKGNQRSSDLQSMKRVMFGGDISTEEVFKQAQSLFPSAKLSTACGMTEACGVLGFTSTPIEKMPIYHGIVSVGKPAAGSNVRIVKSTDEATQNEPPSIVPRNVSGDLHVGGPCVISQYVDNVQSEVFYTDEAGNWLVTGDRAVMDDEGFVFILGRTKDIVKKMGLSLSPAVAETVLRRQPGVEAAVVLGIPSDVYGEVPVAVAKGTPGIDVDRRVLQDAVTAALGDNYTLERVFTLEQLGFETWPLNPTGKIVKVTLRDKILSMI